MNLLGRLLPFGTIPRLRVAPSAREPAASAVPAGADGARRRRRKGSQLMWPDNGAVTLAAVNPDASGCGKAGTRKC